MPQIQMYSLSTRRDGTWYVSIYPRLRDVKNAANKFCISMDMPVLTIKEIEDSIGEHGDFKIENKDVEIHVQEVDSWSVNRFLSHYASKINLFRYS